MLDPNLKQRIEQELHQSTKNYPVSLGLNSIQPVYNGTIWLVGGTVFNMAISIFHNQPLLKPKDADLMLEDEIDYNLIETPQDWTRKSSHFGAIKFVKDEDLIDIWFNGDSNKYEKRGLEPNLENYFKVVPFDVQAIAYDINRRELHISENCFVALKTKTITMNCRARALKYQNQGINYMYLKAKQLGFTPIMT